MDKAKVAPRENPVSPSKIDMMRDDWPDKRREEREETLAHPERGPMARAAGLTIDAPYSEELQEMLLVEEALGKGSEIHEPGYVDDEDQ